MNKHIIQMLFLHEDSPYSGYSGVVKDIQQNTVCGVIEYKDGEFLAGPFELGNKQYGVYTVKRDDPLLPIDEIYEQLKYTPTSTCWMPFAMKKRVYDVVGVNSIVYVDAVTNKWYSDLDLPYIDTTNVVELTPKCKSLLFFKSEGALKQIIRDAKLTEIEIEEWYNAIAEMNAVLKKDLSNTASCIERPLSVCIFGTDDCSWTKNTTESELNSLLEQMKTPDFVVQQMTYTN